MRLLFLVLLPLVITFNDIDVIQLEHNILNSLDETKLKSMLFWFLYQNNGDALASQVQCESLNKWEDIKDELMVLIKNTIKIYNQYSKVGIYSFYYFDFLIQKTLFDSYFKFALNIYKENPSNYPLYNSSIDEYFLKIGNRLYPSYLSTDGIDKIRTAFYFYYDYIYYEFAYFNPNISFANMGFYTGELFLRTIRVLILSEDEFKYFLVFDTIIYRIGEYFTSNSNPTLYQNDTGLYFRPEYCISSNITSMISIKKLVKLACTDRYNCFASNAVKFILTNFKDIVNDYKYCITNNIYSLGTILFPNTYTIETFLFNIEYLYDLDNLDNLYHSQLFLVPYSLFRYDVDILTNVSKKIFYYNFTLLNEYSIKQSDLIRFLHGFIENEDTDTKSIILAETEIESDLVSKIYDNLLKVLQIKVRVLIDYLDIHGIEYLKNKINVSLNYNPVEFYAIQYVKRVSNAAYSYTLNEEDVQNLENEIELESTLHSFLYYLNKYISKIVPFYELKVGLSHFNLSQISAFLIENYSISLNFRNLQKFQKALHSHDFYFLGNRFFDLIISILTKA